jgi:hypothetical protein
MSNYNTKVHGVQGGDEWVIESGGKLTLKAGSVLTSPDVVLSTINTVTLAELNAGKTLVAGVAGFKIVVLNVRALVTGAFTGLTLAVVQSSNGTPVVVTSYTQATLTNGAIFSTTATITGQTLGAGFEVGLGTGDSLVAAKTGSAAAGGTSIKYSIQYQLVAA